MPHFRLFPNPNIRSNPVDSDTSTLRHLSLTASVVANANWPPNCLVLAGRYAAGYCVVAADVADGAGVVAVAAGVGFAADAAVDVSRF